MIQISFFKIPYAINPELAIICKIRKYIEISFADLILIVVNT
jgi:hypothetical protein